MISTLLISFMAGVIAGFIVVWFSSK